MPGDIGWIEAFSSLALIAVVVVISLWRRLDLEAPLIWSSLRAALQLIAVGALFAIIFEATQAFTWSWVWVVGMTLVSTEVVARRTGHLPGVRRPALAALAGSVAVTVGLIFGVGVLAFEPVTLVVIAGLTLGNTLPAAVQSVELIKTEFMDKPERIEGLLALGFDRRGASREVTRAAVRQALLPQIERTKVIGLIALPGTMTGMLLAGAEPIPAVLVQLVIVYLVLGAVGVGAVVVAVAVAKRAFTADLRLAQWVTDR
ncbi:MAG: ABC transporter permease [Acidimicrobiia bacterium]|nr:ABC transporter permease [Acidimicrobiia bacterium]